MDQNLKQRLNNIRLFADELPSALIIHDAVTLEIIYMNRTGLDILGTTLDDLQAMDPGIYHAKYFNTEDSNDYVPKIMHIMHSQVNEQVSYFQQVRVPQNTEWQLFVSNTKVFARNEAGDTTHLITTAGLIDPVHHITSKVNRVMDEIYFLRANNPLFLTLTRREKEVLKQMAMGSNSSEIAEKLFISPATADTHRRNIRNKLNLKNNYDAVKFAQAYNLL
nr:helix-turn-helix transcriptional regulator [uncultured Mucilaginibacter sp.]